MPAQDCMSGYGCMRWIDGVEWAAGRKDLNETIQIAETCHVTVGNSYSDPDLFFRRVGFTPILVP